MSAPKKFQIGLTQSEAAALIASVCAAQRRESPGSGNLYLRDLIRVRKQLEIAAFEFIHQK